MSASQMRRSKWHGTSRPGGVALSADDVGYTYFESIYAEEDLGDSTPGGASLNEDPIDWTGDDDS